MSELNVVALDGSAPVRESAPVLVCAASTWDCVSSAKAVEESASMAPAMDTCLILNFIVYLRRLGKLKKH
jgi:hypothetical protein